MKGIFTKKETQRIVDDFFLSFRLMKWMFMINWILYKAYKTVAINIIIILVFIDNLLKTRGMVAEKEKKKRRRRIIE
jgi:hypothetical protein